MSALILDAGALIAIDRRDRELGATLLEARRRGVDLRTSAIVVAQAWRDPTGKQALLAQLLDAVDVRPVDRGLAREAGVLLGRSGGSDAVDAALVLTATAGDAILTSDPDDIARLVAFTGRSVSVVPI